MDQPVSAATAKDDAFANLGFEILAQGPRGPLIVERTDGDALLIALLFHTDRSTLPYRVGFPIFVSNVVQAALKQSGLAEAAARTGVLPLLTLAPGRAVHITGPDRFAREDRTDDRGQLTGIPAPRAGDYTLTDGTAPRATSAPASSPPPRPPSPPSPRSNSPTNSPSPPPPPCPKPTARSGGSSPAPVSSCCSWNGGGFSAGRA